MLMTANPCADAERWENELEAADELLQEAAREAPGIMLRHLQKLKTPGDWFDKKFIAGNSADDILRLALDDSDDNVGNHYAEFMVCPAPEVRQKMLQAMANWFCEIYAYEIYEDYLRGLSNECH